MSSPALSGSQSSNGIPVVAIVVPLGVAAAAAAVSFAVAKTRESKKAAKPVEATKALDYRPSGRKRRKAAESDSAARDGVRSAFHAERARIRQ
jgi:hypothetical protein